MSSATPKKYINHSTPSSQFVEPNDDDKDDYDDFNDGGIGDVHLFDYNINGLKFKVNIPIERLFTVYAFDDLIPEFHIEEKNPETPKRNIYRAFLKLKQLDNSVVRLDLTETIYETVFKDSNKCTQEEFFKQACEVRVKTMHSAIDACYRAGYQKPSQIQSVSIPQIMQGKDCLIQSKSGTGKSDAFLVSAAWNLSLFLMCPQIIIMSATHDIAIQLYKKAVDVFKGANVVLCIGHKQDTRPSGDFQDDNNSSIRKKTNMELRKELKTAQVIVGTIGKIHDCITNERNKLIDIKNVNTFIVDEFDAIVTTNSNRNNPYSSEKQMEDIVSVLPIPNTEKDKVGCQMLFFSATVTRDAIDNAHKYFRPSNKLIPTPFICLLNDNDLLLEGIKQYYVQVANTEEKIDYLSKIFHCAKISQCFIFLNNKDDVVQLKSYLSQLDPPITSEVLIGKMGDQERARVLDNFRVNKNRILVCTDVAARGLDIPKVNLVINFDMASTENTHIHRIGRAGRFGKNGVAINFVLINNDIDESKKVERLEKKGEQHRMKPLPNDIDSVFKF